MQPPRRVEPWCVREHSVDLGSLLGTASLFALSNGNVGVRGDLDEGGTNGVPGTFLSAVHEERPLTYAEEAYGYPSTSERIVGVADGTQIDLSVDGERLDVGAGSVSVHDRMLDLRSGVLDRELAWTTPGGRSVRLRSRRMVPLTRPGLLIIRYEVEAVSAPLHLVLQSWLHGRGERLEDLQVDRHGGCLLNLATGGLFVVAAAVDHIASAPDGVEVQSDAHSGDICVTVAAMLTPGQVLRLDKLVGYAWSRDVDDRTCRAEADGAVAAARATGWDGLADEQRNRLDRFWNHADVVVEGDDEVQQGVRFGLFHLLQASALSDGKGIPAKGLTGTGYEGHTFWDAESFVLQVLMRTAPELAEHALRWRHAGLPAALERARELGFEGAAFPWRTITGRESSGYWPASTAAFHVSADIADAFVRFIDVTGDVEFERDIALDVLVQTARLWMSLGHYGIDGGWHLDGVTGPDEYSALVDDNAYTNLMAQRNLRAAAHVCRRHPERAADLGVAPEHLQRWIDAAEAVVVPYDHELGVTMQAQRFTQHERWDFGTTPPEDYPLEKHHPYVDLYRKQVLKQADVVLALHARTDSFSLDQKRRDFDYYEPLTVRDSSLSASTQAVIAAEVGHLDLAHAYAREAALVDLQDLRGEIDDGLHLASLAGGWLALVAGFGGLRDGDGQLRFAPRLPLGLRRLAFRLLRRGSRLLVEVREDAASYRLLDGGPLELWHHGELVRVEPGDGPVTKAVPPAPVLREPRQPPGRGAGTCDLGKGSAGRSPSRS